MILVAASMTTTTKTVVSASHDGEEPHPCQKHGNFPLFCSVAEAIEASPLNSTHMHVGLYTADGLMPHIMDGTYEGDAEECECEPLGEACEINGNFPLYCTESAAEEVSPTGAAHAMMDLWMPTGSMPHHMDGSYEGDAARCNCACQFSGSFPFFCSVADAIEASPLNSTHMHMGLYMADGLMPHVMDGTYVGDDRECACRPLDGACQTEGDFPLYCTSAEAEAVSPTGEAHDHHGLSMPTGSMPHHMDGSYEGDAPECSCADDNGDDMGDDRTSSGGSKKKKKSSSATVRALAIALPVAFVALVAIAALALCSRRRAAASAKPAEDEAKPVPLSEADKAAAPGPTSTEDSKV